MGSSGDDDILGHFEPQPKYGFDAMYQAILKADGETVINESVQKQV